ncbi:MAG: amidohydrolase [Oscillospiraceae bacterium]|nr:amidohydrolase [Oscillospiraceae bacterium]
MRSGHYVIDVHTHVYPPKIAEKASDATGGFYGVGHEQSGLPEDLLACMDAAGIDVSLIHSVATTPQQVSAINEFLAGTANASNGRLVGLGTLHPDSLDQAADVRHLVELGLRGVKLHPEIQRFAVDEPRSFCICALCEEAGLPLLLHTGDRRYDCSNPNRLIPLLRQFPHLKVIGAHLGGWSIYEEAARQLAGFENLWFDCSSTFYWLDPKIAASLIRMLGTDRVMFGSDFPMWTPKTELNTLLALGFSDSELESILSKTAKSVFGL